MSAADTNDASALNTQDQDPQRTSSAQDAGRPKDRNARVREAAARKLAESKRAPERKSALTTEELVDDALARGVAKFGKWLRHNLKTIEVGIVVLLMVGIGALTWDWYSTRRTEKSTAALMTGVTNEQGLIVPDDQKDKPKAPDQDDTAEDPRPKFKTPAARQEAALGAYRTAAAQFSNSGPGILARLGEAGVLLERREWDSAIKAYGDVLATSLAKADADVRLNAIEGTGIALQGKGDLDGAMREFKKLEESTVRIYKELGQFHQATILFNKGDRDGAKALLLKLKEGLGTPKPSDAANAPGAFVREQAFALLRQIDPTAVPASAPMGNPDMSLEQMRAFQEQLQRMRESMPPTPEPAQPIQVPGNAASPKETPSPASSKAN